MRSYGSGLTPEQEMLLENKYHFLRQKVGLKGDILIATVDYAYVDLLLKAYRRRSLGKWNVRYVFTKGGHIVTRTVIGDHHFHIEHGTAPEDMHAMLRDIREQGLRHGHGWYNIPFRVKDGVAEFPFHMMEVGDNFQFDKVLLAQAEEEAAALTKRNPGMMFQIRPMPDDIYACIRK